MTTFAVTDTGDGLDVTLNGTTHRLDVEDASRLAHRILDVVHAAYPERTGRGLESWPTERVEEFVADLERTVNPDRPGHILRAARVELDRRRGDVR
ncbi:MULTISPECIES: hypothetical protein [Rhodococcus]|uniref:Uncharacterized protein n=2 Tax=Rhodococcus TaxID=1827 RepID=A0A0M9WP62_RHORH|nr:MULTISPECIES: hypothetical protein [Rhodococcus]KOS56360.1 hypothetical protein Z051_09790 [Rhodococcus rhodochrous KG-21]MDM7490232.1 hypothetical protein [Rhodococcus indonesiensis]